MTETIENTIIAVPESIGIEIVSGIGEEAATIGHEDMVRKIAMTAKGMIPFSNITRQSVCS